MTTETTTSGVDIDAIRQRLARHASAIGPGGEKAWRAGQLAADVPALLAKVDELTERIERRRLRLVEAENDLLDVRGILSPNGYPRRVPVDLVPTVAPAVRWLADRVEELTAALAAKDAVVDAAKRVTATWRFHACIPTADLELTIGEEERKLAEAVDSLPTEIAPNGCDDCSVEPGERHRYFRCPGNGKALLRAGVAR